MDSHINAHPIIDPEAGMLSARLPGETDPALHPGDPTTQHGDEGAQTAAAGVQDPASPSRGRPKRRRALLAAWAGASLAAAAAGAFVLSSDNHVISVPHLASAVQQAAASVGVKLPPILAPSASLANVALPPTPSATRPAYQAKSRDQQVAELLSLHPGANASPAAAPATPPRAGGHPEAAAPAHPSAGASPSPTAAPATAMLEGSAISADEIPHEPGALPVPAATVRPPTPTPVAVVEPSPAPTILTDMPAAVPAPLPVSVAAHAAPAAQHVAASAAAPRPAATATANQEHQPDVEPADALSAAREVHAAPMTPAEQVEIINMVTEIASMVRDIRKQDTQLRADLGKASADTAARLRDYERRLAMAEAKTALAAASGAAEEASHPAPEVLPVGASVIPVSITRTLPVAPVHARQAAAPPADVPVPAAAKSYRVQAASPGLAMLAQVDRGGGEGAQMQVVVGDTIPDWGRVKSIAQKGTAWVVLTERGPIQ